MSDDWPAPESADDATTASNRRPPARSRQSYALRQATVLLAVLVAAAAVVALVVSRGDDDEQGADVPVVEPRGWDTVVLVDPTSDRLVVSGADGAEVGAGSTALSGLLDVGVDGVVLAGISGTPSVEGLGVIDLATGQVDRLTVAHDRLARLDATPLLIATDSAGATGSMQLVDVARRRVSELAPLAGAGAVVLPDEVRASPDGRYVAFTDLSRATTVVLDVATGSRANVPGAVADVSLDRVATITNRGATVLVDLTDLRGTRLGTVETAPLAGVLITGPTEAIAVSTSGSVLRLDFAEGSSDATSQLASPDPATSATAAGDDDAGPAGQVSDVVLDIGVVAARQRLAVTLPGTLVLVGTDGEVAATIEAALPLPRLDGNLPGARCLHVIGSSVEPSLLVDATTGTKVGTVAAGSLVALAADGCVAVVQALGSTVSSIVGDGIELEVGDPVLAVAPDSTAILLGGVRPRIVLLDGSSTEVALPRVGTAGTFATRIAPG